MSGSLWGAVVVSVTGDKTFADDDEERIGEFANLVAVALANAEAREQVAALAEGRAALSRVAVAVATATRPSRSSTSSPKRWVGCSGRTRPTSSASTG